MFIYLFLRELELFDTKLDEFPVEAFAELDLLERLVLDGHAISHLNVPIRGLPLLKEFRVSNGNISAFGKETFSALGAKLARLDLHGNKLKGVPKDAFQVNLNSHKVYKLIKLINSNLIYIRFGKSMFNITSAL